MTPAFEELSIIDSHVHFVHTGYMDDILALMDAVPCTKFNLVCIPNPDGTTHNPAAIYFKQHHPKRLYISGALDYRSVLAEPDHGAGLLASQVRTLKMQGFDGLKLIEGKPQVRKLLPYPLDGPLYSRVWSALEEEQLPVVFHAADPDEFWDEHACPDWARESGWDYSDGSYPSKEDLYKEVEHILERHPRLKIIFAHFCFLSKVLGRAGQFLDNHPTVSFDLAPHLDMYKDFSQKTEEAIEFFHHYQDRILFGTDTDTRALQRGIDGYRFMRSVPVLIRSFLEKNGEFTLPGGTKYHGLGLPNEILDKIYHANFERIYGLCPVALNSSGNFYVP